MNTNNDNKTSNDPVVLFLEQLNDAICDYQMKMNRGLVMQAALEETISEIADLPLVKNAIETAEATLAQEILTNYDGDWFVRARFGPDILLLDEWLDDVGKDGATITVLKEREKLEAKP